MKYLANIMTDDDLDTFQGHFLTLEAAKTDREAAHALAVTLADASAMVHTAAVEDRTGGLRDALQAFFGYARGMGVWPWTDDAPETDGGGEA